MISHIAHFFSKKSNILYAIVTEYRWSINRRYLGRLNFEIFTEFVYTVVVYCLTKSANMSHKAAQLQKPWIAERISASAQK